MSRGYNNDGCGSFIAGFLNILVIIIWIVFGIVFFLIKNESFLLDNLTVILYSSMVFFIISFIVLYFKQKRKYETKIEYLKEQQHKIVSNFQKDKFAKEKELKELQINLQKKGVEIKKIKQCVSEKDRLYESYNTLDLHNISTLYADFLTLEYYLSAEWLEEKNDLLKQNPGFFKRTKGGRPAMRAAEVNREYGARAKLYKKEYKMMLYKYDVLLSLFPELNNYVDDIETIKLLTSFENIDTLKEEYDRVVDYIPKEEYNKMNVNARNQLALDNYIKGRKTNWQIGRDYEMYCARKYEEKGWKVERFGIEKGLNDMGRDLIATKGDLVHIIQCKFWSEHKLIHEKHIAQLYGSTIEYSISHEGDLIANSKERDLFTIAYKIVPVFITNIDLSETAERFAKRLGVEIFKWDIEEFPRIKCNVNNGDKIYHLPFDQQYDRTKIINAGESYEFTVKAATAKGFRRAKKHLFTNV